MPWWGYPIAGAGLLVGVTTGAALAVAEAAIMAGESPFDRWERLRFTVRYAWLRFRGSVR